VDALIGNELLRAVEHAILALLVLLGVACAIVFTLRWNALGRARLGALQTRALLESDLADALNAAATPGDLSLSYTHGETNLADRILHVALRNAHLCPEALEKLLETQEVRARESLECGTQFLGTVGANAPFLGLTGTVLGILAAFRKMAEQGGGGTEVMSAIAGALIATAAGLLVAIPAVILYNLLKARVKKTLNALGEIRSLLLARSLQASVAGNF
jgi:biopolymer transport protein ExbB/TolQ